MTALHHALGGGTCEPEIGFEIDLDNGFPVLVLHTENKPITGNAGIGDQDIEA